MCICGWVGRVSYRIFSWEMETFIFQGFGGRSPEHFFIIWGAICVSNHDILPLILLIVDVFKDTFVMTSLLVFQISRGGILAGGGKSQGTPAHSLRNSSGCGCVSSRSG